MTLHTLTTTTKLASRVLVTAPPGERPARVIDLAIKEVDKIREKVGLKPPFTEVHVGVPQYQDGRKWLVIVSTIATFTDIVED